MVENFPAPQNLADLFPALLIDAERVAASVWQGVHGRRRAGSGESFWQFRAYEPGDAADRIDWRQSARSDKVFIRQKEWEAAQTAYIWADNSGSMHYASEKSLPTKAVFAQTLMLALASLLLRAGEKVGWINNDQLIMGHGNQGMQKIARQISITPRTMENLPPALDFARHAHMILCGDFLADPEAVAAFLAQAAARQMRGCLVHILDPLEHDFSIQGRVEIEGLENEATLHVSNAGELKSLFRARMSAHQANLSRLAQSANWFYICQITEEKPEVALFKIYDALSVEL